MEKEAQQKYDELVDTDDENTLEEHHQDEELRLEAITKAESTAKKIVEVGNIWTYEKKTPPEAEIQRNMDDNMLSDLRDELHNVIDALDDTLVKEVKRGYTKIKNIHCRN